jgi:hypothetical protein
MSRADSLLSRPARIVVVGAAVVAAIAIAAGSFASSTTPTPVSRAASHPISIECDLFHRAAVTRELRTGPVIQVTRGRRTARVGVASFTFTAKLVAEPGRADSTSLSIRISHRTTSKVIAAALYQGVTNNHYATHGFTGLQYVYSPQGAELQYFCRSRR